MKTFQKSFSARGSSGAARTLFWTQMAQNYAFRKNQHRLRMRGPRTTIICQRGHRHIQKIQCGEIAQKAPEGPGAIGPQTFFSKIFVDPMTPGQPLCIEKDAAPSPTVIVQQKHCLYHPGPAGTPLWAIFSNNQKKMKKINFWVSSGDLAPFWAIYSFEMSSIANALS